MKKFLFFSYFLCKIPIFFLFSGTVNSYFPIFWTLPSTWPPAFTITYLHQMICNRTLKSSIFQKCAHCMWTLTLSANEIPFGGNHGIPYWWPATADMWNHWKPYFGFLKPWPLVYRVEPLTPGLGVPCSVSDLSRHLK